MTHFNFQIWLDNTSAHLFWTRVPKINNKISSLFNISNFCYPPIFFKRVCSIPYKLSTLPTSIPSPTIIKQWSWHFDRSLRNHINFCAAKTVPFVSKLLPTQPAFIQQFFGDFQANMWYCTKYWVAFSPAKIALSCNDL